MLKNATTLHAGTDGRVKGALPSALAKELPSPHRNLTAYYESRAADWSKSRWQFYVRSQHRLIRFLIPSGSRVLEIGCANGDLLAAVGPSCGVGLDLSAGMVAAARMKHPHLRFYEMDAHDLRLEETFDYVILSDLVGDLYDVLAAFRQLPKVCKPGTRVVLIFYNFLWEPVLKLAERLGLKTRQNLQNWLSLSDLRNLLDLSGFEVIKNGYNMPLPVYVPPLSTWANRCLGLVPVVRRMGVQTYLVARPKATRRVTNYTCSVVVPCRNERGNIASIVERVPEMGAHTEIIFVEGGSKDGTLEEIRSVMAAAKGRDLKLIEQGNGTGKGDAVRKGFAAATGDVLMILDADLTVDPEYLPQFFHVITSGAGEMVIGSRLVYPMERHAMRYLNMLGNKFFSRMFSWLLDQPIKDTLCGTKVLLRSDYQKIADNRTYFGDFDPFGDFDLLFGAAKLNFKIVEIPVRYRERSYGSTNISRFRNGFQLLRMSLFAARKFKFI